MRPLRWLATLFHRRRAYAHISTAIEEHLEEKVADLMDLGLPRKEAEQRARREFGNPALIEERSREVWHFPVIESTWADLRFAAKSLSHSPAFTFTVVAVLALGLATSTCIFAFLLKQLPYQDPSRLVAVVGTTRSCSECNLSYLTTRT